MNTKFVRGILVAVAAVFFVALLGYSTYPPGEEEASGDLIHVRVGLSWIHEAQFAGLYWADQKGLYEEEGLAVELVPYQGEDLAQELVDGNYDFVIMQTDTLIQAREEGLPVKAIFADYRLLPTCYFSKKDAKITKPEDLIGKTVGVAYSERYPLVGMLDNKGVNISEVNIVEREYNYNALADDTFDAEAGWVTDGDTVEAAVGDYDVMHPYDYGVNWYADLIVTTEGRIEADDALVAAFIRATQEGWEEAVENRDEAALLTQNYDPEMDAEHLKFVLDVSIPLIHTGEQQIGWIDATVLQQAQEFLLDQEVIHAPITVQDAYTMEFLNNAS